MARAANVKAIQFKVDRLQIILVGTKYISTCPNSYTDNCPDHSKISTAEVRHWIGEQKCDSDQRDKKVARDDFPL